MHHSQKIRTLITCIADLRQVVNEMSAEAPVHHADKELLLHHARLFYESLLELEAQDAVAPAEAPKNELHRLAEEVSQTIEEVIEEVLEQGEAAELDIEISTAEDEDPAEAPQADIAANEAVADAVAANLPEEAVIAPENNEEVETAAAAEDEADQTEEAEEVPETPAVAPQIAEIKKASSLSRSLAFSLTGFIEKTGDSHLVMAHLKLKPIEDLKSGIGLNEKFLFIRELFENDHMAYAEAIEKLNAAPDLDTAEEVLGNELLPKYNWDLDTEASMSFLHLIFRRFAGKA